MSEKWNSFYTEKILSDNFNLDSFLSTTNGKAMLGCMGIIYILLVQCLCLGY